VVQQNDVRIKHYGNIGPENWYIVAGFASISIFLFFEQHDEILQYHDNFCSDLALRHATWNLSYLRCRIIRHHGPLRSDRCHLGDGALPRWHWRSGLKGKTTWRQDGSCNEQAGEIHSHDDCGKVWCCWYNFCVKNGSIPWDRGEDVKNNKSGDAKQTGMNPIKKISVVIIIYTHTAHRPSGKSSGDVTQERIFNPCRMFLDTLE